MSSTTFWMPCKCTTPMALQHPCLEQNMVFSGASAYACCKGSCRSASDSLVFSVHSRLMCAQRLAS